MPETTDLTFWFDPVCPFTWRTAQWAWSAASRSGYTVTWRVMSLAILNDGREIPEQYREGMRQAPRAHRLIVATERADGQAGLLRLYRAIGERLHGTGEPLGTDLLAAALADAGLPAELIRAADDTALDQAVRTSHEAGQARVGTDAGTPVTAFGAGPGFHGPIIAEVPDPGAGDRLWDALRLLVGVPGFSELKRAREPWSPAAES